MVRCGSKVCDIGTDHAYLPSYLILNQKIPSALACDIGEGPLDNAAKTVETYHLSEKITLRLSDGLDAVNGDEADDFVFCGMGGELIAELAFRDDKIKKAGKRIVAQPQSHIEVLRRSLAENGFKIIGENACEDSGHIYVCICAEYDGVIRDYSPGFYYYGLLPELDNSEADQFVFNQLNRLEKRRSGIENVAGSENEKVRLDSEIREIREVIGK